MKIVSNYKDYKFNSERLLKYGFSKRKNNYIFEKNMKTGNFFIKIVINSKKLNISEIKI